MVAAVVATVLASAVSAYASYKSGQSQKEAAEFNASMSEQQAANAREAARVKSEQAQRAYSRQLASMRAGYSAAGLELSTGTPLMVLMDSASEAAKDIERIKKGGESQANLFQGEAGLQRLMGNAAYTAGVLGAGVSLLGGASKVGSMYAGYNAKVTQ